MMKEKPTKWEVVCKNCLAGLVMSDAEVLRRLSNERLWPKHCGEIMALRHIVTSEPVQECSHTGCWCARNAVCNCSCRGKNHAAMNPEPTFTKLKVGELAWYKKPIKRLITV